MNPLTGRRENPRHGILGEPFDLHVGPQRPELPGDGHVALRVAQADR
jgi:hypothetical protein